MRMKSPQLLIVLLLALAAALAIFFLALQNRLQQNAEQTVVPLASHPSAVNVAGVTYQNDTYGFTFALPESWKGYTIVSGSREIRDVNSGKVVATAPTIRIRHPEWTTQNPREDIPIDIYTLAEWAKIQNGDYAVSAAPIPPTELGRNSKYIFALPARYNYDFLTGWEEVQKIIDSKPLSSFESGATINTSDWKIYRNEKYGFEFRYPVDWIYNNLLSGIDLTNYSPGEVEHGGLAPAGGIEITVESLTRSSNQPLKQFAQDKSAQLFDNLKSSEDRTINGCVANQIVLNSPPPAVEEITDVYIDCGKNMIVRARLTIYVASQQRAVQISTFESILSTIKLVSLTSPAAADTSSWKTYRNDKYRFEFMYPGDNWDAQVGGADGDFWLVQKDGGLGSPTIFFQVRENRSTTTIDDMAARDISQKKLVVDGEKAMQSREIRPSSPPDPRITEWIGGLEKITTVIHLDKIYRISGYSGDNAVAVIEKLYDQLLSTFKFIQ